MGNETPSQKLQVDLKADLLELINVTIIKTTDHQYNTECENVSSGPQSVLCPIPNPSFRNISNIEVISYPYNSFELTNLITNIRLDYNGSYNISKAALGLSSDGDAPNLPGNMTLSDQDAQNIQNQINQERNQNNQDPSINVGISAVWHLVENMLDSYSFFSSKIANIENLVFSLGDQSCVALQVVDKVYELKLFVNSFTRLTSLGIDNATSLLQNITAGHYSLLTRNNELGFYIPLEMKANLIISKIVSLTPKSCETETVQPTAVPQITSGLYRYGVKVVGSSSQNAIGQFYGFDSSVVNSVFNYDFLDKYNLLIKRDNCFKIWIWIVIPTPLFPIVFPLWIDASIVVSFLENLQDVVKAANSVLKFAIDQAREIKSNLNAKHVVEMQKRALAFVKGLASEEGIVKLAMHVKDVAEKQQKKAESVANYDKISKTLNAINDFITTVVDILENLPNNPIITRIGSLLSSEPGINTIRDFAETITELAKLADTIYNNVLKLIDALPDNIFKEKIQLILKDLYDYIEIIKTVTRNNIEKFIAEDVSLVDRFMAFFDVFFDKTALKQLIKLANDVNFANDIYKLVLEELKNSELVKLQSEIEEVGAKQEKSAAEREVVKFAEQAASEIDNVVGTVAEVLQIKRIDNLANEAVDLALSGISKAADGIGSAADGVGERKRSEIRDMLSYFLKAELDIYKITRIGSFDENYPNEKQILINDLAGTRIYSSNGTELLFARRELCRHPFTDLGNTRLNKYGCDAGADPCSVGGFNCQERTYWFNAFKYRVSFDFYTNHDLSIGGVLIGDFDGDGVDDLMCHYPISTRDYDKITKDPQNRGADDLSDVVTNNEIIYAPLKAYSTKGRFESRESVLLIDYKNNTTPIADKHWCKKGRITVGDFNADKKDDLLCITDSSNYLLYSQGFTFYYANATGDGSLSIGMSGGLNSLYSAQIISGDFDGDGFDDIIALSSNKADIYFGDQELIFVTNQTKASYWIANDQSRFTDCYKNGVNRIISADINNDGKDDISCISQAGVEVIHSTIPSIKELNNSSDILVKGRSEVIIYVNDVDLELFKDAVNPSALKITKSNLNIYKNLGHGGSKLIGHDSMVSEYKSISNIAINTNCLNLSNISSKLYVSFNKEYVVPRSLLWENTDNKGNILINLDVSADFVDEDLISIKSSRIQSFTQKLEAYQGGCYKSELATNLVSILVNYNATAKMLIKQDGLLLRGKDFNNAIKNILSDYEIQDESLATFKMDGQFKANILGVGYSTVSHCQEGDV